MPIRLKPLWLSVSQYIILIIHEVFQRGWSPQQVVLELGPERKEDKRRHVVDGILLVNVGRKWAN